MNPPEACMVIVGCTLPGSVWNSLNHVSIYIDMCICLSVYMYVSAGVF